MNLAVANSLQGAPSVPVPASSFLLNLISFLLFWAQIHLCGTTKPFSPSCRQLQQLYPQSVTGH